MSTQTLSQSRPSTKRQTGVKAYAATAATSPLAAYAIQRRTALADDVVIDILYSRRLPLRICIDGPQ